MVLRTQRQSPFWKFLKENDIQEALENIMSGLDRIEYSNLALIGERARSLILKVKCLLLFPSHYQFLQLFM